MGKANLMRTLFPMLCRRCCRAQKVLSLVMMPRRHRCSLRGTLRNSRNDIYPSLRQPPRLGYQVRLATLRRTLRTVCLRCRRVHKVGEIITMPQRRHRRMLLSPRYELYPSPVLRRERHPGFPAFSSCPQPKNKTSPHRGKPIRYLQTMQHPRMCPHLNDATFMCPLHRLGQHLRLPAFTLQAARQWCLQRLPKGKLRLWRRSSAQNRSVLCNTIKLRR
mmetsp:Transcript_33287/g.80276  ORF Transcript_33287/g.80276 Transcript_33287/m.80276 type:complete len:219 (-) Transcript_33287:272-928(-)